MEAATTQGVATGLNSLMDIAPVVTVLVLVIIGGYYLFMKAIRQCEMREERAVEKWEKATEVLIDTVKESTKANHGMQYILTDIKERLLK